MTLGGLTIAIGLLVDDAIIAVENVFRRLREAFRAHRRWGKREAERRAPDRTQSVVVAVATTEVVSPILFATLIIILVFLPIFFLPGLEGRLLRPLGLAFIAALAASLAVALTVTPVLCVAAPRPFAGSASPRTLAPAAVAMRPTGPPSNGASAIAVSSSPAPS